jgi:phage shock protein E
MRKTTFVFFTLVSLLLSLATRAETVWIDVRTLEEYAQDHVDGDANIPLAEFDPTTLVERFPEATEFMLYCRSGNRAGQAKDLLEAAGFTNVVNAGGIDDVRKLRETAITARSAASQATGAVAIPPR